MEPFDGGSFDLSMEILQAKVEAKKNKQNGNDGIDDTFHDGSSSVSRFMMAVTVGHAHRAPVLLLIFLLFKYLAIW